MFHEETYPEIPLLPGETNPDEGVYQLIKHSKLHKVAAHPAVFPFAETISWIISRTDIDNRLIRDTNGKAIASFQTSALDIYENFPTTEVDLTDEWMLRFPLDCREVMKSW